MDRRCAGMSITRSTLAEHGSRNCLPDTWGDGGKDRWTGPVSAKGEWQGGTWPRVLVHKSRTAIHTALLERLTVCVGRHPDPTNDTSSADRQEQGCPSSLHSCSDPQHPRSDGSSSLPVWQPGPFRGSRRHLRHPTEHAGQRTVKEGILASIRVWRRCSSGRRRQWYYG